MSPDFQSHDVTEHLCKERQGCDLPLNHSGINQVYSCDINQNQINYTDISRSRALLSAFKWIQSKNKQSPFLSKTGWNVFVRTDLFRKLRVWFHPLREVIFSLWINMVFYLKSLKDYCFSKMITNLLSFLPLSFPWDKPPTPNFISL